MAFNTKKSSTSASYDNSTKTAAADNESLAVTGNYQDGKYNISTGNVGKKGKVSLTVIEEFPQEAQDFIASLNKQNADLISTSINALQSFQTDSISTLQKGQESATAAILDAKQETRSLIKTLMPAAVLIALVGVVALTMKKKATIA
jgi:hypothetical protein